MIKVPPPPDHQLRHEAPDLGDAVIRLLRALVTRAAHGDTFALEQLARLEALTPTATALAMRLAHDHNGYSFTQVAHAVGVTRQAARQRAMGLAADDLVLGDLEAHQLIPGHRKAACPLESCKRRYL